MNTSSEVASWFCSTNRDLLQAHAFFKETKKVVAESIENSKALSSVQKNELESRMAEILHQTHYGESFWTNVLYLFIIFVGVSVTAIFNTKPISASYSFANFLFGITFVAAWIMCVIAGIQTHIYVSKRREFAEIAKNFSDSFSEKDLQRLERIQHLVSAKPYLESLKSEKRTSLLICELQALDEHTKKKRVEIILQKTT